MSKIITDEKIIDEILSRSVVEVLPGKKELKEKLMSGEKLKFYIGTDATGTSLHVGHATNYMVLEKFRQLGHEAYLLIGDFTARIGDPTDKGSARQQLSKKQVKENIKTWTKQLKPVLNFKDFKNPVKVVYNSKWLAKMSFEDVIELSSHFTVQRMLERDMFEKRIKEGKPIHVHEFFYPLMQGYDSVALDVDVEICGNDQKFNALCGRTLLKKYKNKEKFVFITTLLENPVTGEKMMSKSMGTGIFLDASANDMYGSVMAQPDENIVQLFVDCTYVEIEKINKIKTELKSGTNPRNIKAKLAYEITKIYHGEKLANEAQEYFDKVISGQQTPDEIKEFKTDKTKILDILTESGLTKSNSEARQIIAGSGVKVNNEVINDIEFEPKSGDVIQKGKRGFIKLKKL